MVKTLGDYIVILLSIIGSIASIFGYVQFIAPHLNDQGMYGVIFMGIITLFFLTYNVYLLSKYRKKVRYVDVFEDMNIGFSELHKLDRKENLTDKDIIDGLKYICTQVSNSFTKIDGQHIATCIKFLTIEDNRPIVQTLCRDSKSLKDRKVGKNDSVKHWLSENSDFNFIYQNIDSENNNITYFSERFLPWNYDYANTRLTNWPPKKVLFLNYILRQIEWPLKYRSSIVVPIVPLMADDQNKKALRGFLCIDSPRNIAFNEHIDVEILKGMADGIYNKIDKLHQLLNQNEK